MAAIAATVIAAPAFGKGPSPSALYSKLLTSTMPTSMLPSGFSDPKTSYQPVSSAGKKYDAVGEVVVTTSGADPEDDIAIEVFPSAADATNDVKHASLGGEHVIGSVPGVAHSELLAGSETGKNAFGSKVTNGVTDAIAVAGNVTVQGLTSSSDNTSSGNVPAAIALLKAGIKYEQSLGG